MNTSRLRYFDPRWLVERRHLIIPYARNYLRDMARATTGAALAGRARLAELGLGLTVNDRRMAHFKNLHAGRRAFVIGNGPSLRISDLDRLSDQITFASNNIFAAFADTMWRPTYYAFYHPAEELLLGLGRQLECVTFLPVAERKKTAFLQNAVYFRNRHEWFFPDRPRFSTDVAQGVYWGGTVTYVLLQLAFYMGIKEVFLIGVDHDYGTAAPVSGPDGGVPVWTWNFHPNYYEPGTNFADPARFPEMEHHLACWTLAYQSARKAFESVGGHIYNATRGGKLDVFPRVSLDEVIS